MPWRTEAAFAALMTTGPVEWIRSLSDTTRSVLLIGSTAAALAGAGFGAGIWWISAQSEWGSHPDRILALEDWRTFHTEDVSEPGMARIQALEEDFEEFEKDLRSWLEGPAATQQEMVYQLYCDRFATRCAPQPREE